MFTISNNFAKDRSRSLSASYGMPSLNTLGMNSGLSNFFSAQTTVSIQSNNTYLNERLDFLHTKASEIQSGLDLTQVNSKEKHLDNVWNEAEDVKMGGHGSIEGGWTEDEIKELPDRVDKNIGGVAGAEGHHQKNAASHPEHQANPNNIKFFRTRDLHKEIGHRGDWKNETDDPFIDKDQMLKDTTKNNNLKAEIVNIKMVVYMAAGVGFAIGTAVTLALEGISFKTIQKGIICGSKQAIRSTAFSLVGYGIGRIVGDRFTNVVLKQLVTHGLQLSPATSILLNQTISGVVVTTLFLSVTYIKLRLSGFSPSIAIQRLGPVAAMSFVGLVLSSIVSYFFNKPGAIIFGMLWSAGQVWYIKYQDNHRKETIRKLEYFRLEHSMPIYVEGTVV